MDGTVNGEVIAVKGQDKFKHWVACKILEHGPDAKPGVFTFDGKGDGSLSRWQFIGWRVGGATIPGQRGQSPQVRADIYVTRGGHLVVHSIVSDWTYGGADSIATIEEDVCAFETEEAAISHYTTIQGPMWVTAVEQALTDASAQCSAINASARRDHTFRWIE